MAQLLIVDDEDYAVAGIKVALPWVELGIDTVHAAFSVPQAREILARVPIDVILSDIEMPHENGLDLLAWVRKEQIPAEVIFLTCHDDFSLIQRALRLRGFDYLMKPVSAQELTSAVTRALSSRTGTDRIAAASDSPGAPASTQEEPLPDLPDTNRWVILLKGGAKERVRYEVRAYLDKVPVRQRNDPLILRRLLLDFQQVLSAVLKTHSLSAHNLLDTFQSAELFHQAAESQVALMLWVDFALDRVAAQWIQSEKSGTPFGRACSYIAQHVAEDLSCEQIAAQVDFHPDYLTRLFKKETGLSVSSYVTKARMVFAAELLTGTKQPVSDIALQLGYSNPAHFSKVFRKIFQRSPIEYRSQSPRAQVVLP